MSNSGLKKITLILYVSNFQSTLFDILTKVFINGVFVFFHVMKIHIKYTKKNFDNS